VLSKTLDQLVQYRSKRSDERFSEHNILSPVG
jgi:hypothetical protein